MANISTLVIAVSANREVTLGFENASTGELRKATGSFVQPAPTVLPDDDPTGYGQSLSDALFGSGKAREVFVAALAATVHASPSRPLQIRLELAEELGELHRYAWETLVQPDDAQPLMSRDTVYFARYLQSEQDIGIPPAKPRALVFIANPASLAEGHLVSPGGVRLYPVNVQDELNRVTESLGLLVGYRAITSVEGQKGVASLDCLLSNLRDPGAQPYDVLYLVCHGSGAGLWLDQPDDRPVDAQLLVKGLRDMDKERRPRLVVLASCESAARAGDGREPATVDGGALARLGPRLVREAGVAAIVAMQGNIYMRSVAVMMPAFFKELVRTGRVDGALAQARARLRAQTAEPVRDQWFVPALFTCRADGQLWPGDLAAPVERKTFEPETVLVAGGEFWMGSDDGPGIPQQETPLHMVTLAAYRIGKFPVTNAQYLAFAREQRIAIAPEAGWELAPMGQMPPPGRENHPMAGVTWDEAVAYCRWLAGKTGRNYRLPTEAQWEKAARGPASEPQSTRRYPWGDSFAPSLCNAAEARLGETSSAGAYSPGGDSPFGCADMAGNVWEWTSTRWGSQRAQPQYTYPYEPDDGRENMGAELPFREYRLMRGGSYEDPADRVTCYARGRDRADRRHSRRGFRVAMDVSQG